MIDRSILISIQNQLFKGKVIQLSGPRQVGKTTLLKTLADRYEEDVLWLNGDEADVRELLQDTTSAALKSILAGHKLVIIDEAQRIRNVGLCLKLIVDHFPEVQTIASGSSAFELSNEINEPLTGRKMDYHLYPISFSEMVKNHGLVQEKRLLEQRLIYGSYPEVVTQIDTEVEVLRRLSDAYLYKDIFVFENIKKPMLVEKLLQALAFQVGHEVSSNELGQLLGADHKTIDKYIDLLEKAYIIFSLPSLSRNMRNEIKRGRKIYFFDNGIRNALIRNFNPIGLRDDVGALWENFMISERLKLVEYSRLWMNRFFWRTHSQQEIDYIEEYKGVLHAFEMKWNRKRRSKIPASFQKSYPGSSFEVVNRGNYYTFLEDNAPM
ncbi:MAG: ATP-binding protein [Cyclobacteriaceae bacterium]|nr:ATP-binding protein [Cyclobacteriaceae bacterium HetDA_MAG_MS6]